MNTTQFMLLYAAVGASLIALTTHGQTPTPTPATTTYSAKLSWTANPPDQQVTSYNLYEGARLVMTVPASLPSVVTLTGIVAGSHRYTLTAINAAKIESPRSNEAVITVPAPPNAPAGLTSQ